MITRLKLDELAEKYETVEFIKDDPIQFPHRYQNIREIELVGFISSLFAYGNRKVFIQKLEELFFKMGENPIEYIKNADFSNLKGFYYRFAKEEDVISIFQVLSKLYNSNDSLENLFRHGYEKTNDIIGMLQIVADYFYSNTQIHTSGFTFMIANPKNKGAMKRMNMFLRWMVRKSNVDFGIWKFIKTCDLLIPLDTHVAKLSRQMGLLTRKGNDIKSVLEISNRLKELNFDDPIKYDFAIFGLGVNT